MKHRITITLIVFCAMCLGIGQFAGPNTARASANQIHVGVGIGIAPNHHRHHRRHRRPIVIAPRVIEHHDGHHDNGNHRGQEKREDHGKDRH